MSAAAGLGATAVAGGATGVRLDNATLAAVGPAAVVTSQSDIVVSAVDLATVTNLSGALAAGGTAVGASVGVAVVTKDTRATVGAGATLTANASGGSTLVADSGFQLGNPTATGGLFDPVGGTDTLTLRSPHGLQTSQAVRHGSSLPGCWRG